MMSQNEEIHNVNWERVIIPPCNYKFINFQRNDTIFSLRIYTSKEGTDSVVYEGYAIRFSKSKWITNKGKLGDYSILKYKKTKPSVWFKENNGKLFQADYQCRYKGVSKQFTSYGTVITYRPCIKWTSVKRVRPKDNQYNLHVPP